MQMQRQNSFREPIRRDNQAWLETPQIIRTPSPTPIYTKNSRCTLLALEQTSYSEAANSNAARASLTL